MAEGTRSKSMEDRLGLLEVKFIEFAGESDKGRTEVNQKMMEMSQQIEELGIGLGKVDGKFDEIKQILVNGQQQGRHEGAQTQQGSTTEAKGGNGSRSNYREEVPSTARVLYPQLLRSLLWPHHTHNTRTVLVLINLILSITINNHTPTR